jgi:hypothetical protein
LDADDSTVLDLAAGGLTVPTRAAKVGDLLFVGGGAIYGGSRKTAQYTTGTVTTTTGSQVVTGAGTLFSANVDAGMLFRVGSERVYVVQSVDSNTQITLSEAYQGTTAGGKSYTLKAVETATSPYRQVETYATIFDRLLAASGNTLEFSALRSSTTGLTQPHSFAATDRHVMPGGADILGVEALRDVVFVFTTGGVYSVLGMAFNLLDPAGVSFQQRIELVNRDVVLWGKEGVATTGNALIVPAIDGVYRMGVASAPELLSRSITPLYVEYVRAGYRPGGAVVFRNTYMLPILDSAGVVVDFLVCRLDRPTQARGIGVLWPWARWDGHGGNVTALALRVGGPASARSPNVLAASKATAGRVLKLAGCWEPSAARKNDADASTHQWRVETRDVATGNGNLNTVRRVRIRYELLDAASDDPKINAYYSVGAPVAGQPLWGGVLWGSFSWGDATLDEFAQLAGQAPEDVGRTPYTWVGWAARTRHIRTRFQCSAPCQDLVLRSVEWFVRRAAKDR